MKIEYHKVFIKHYQQRILPYPSIDKKFQLRIKLLIKSLHNPDPVLRVHRLKGLQKMYYSFSVTGDIRVIYRVEGDVIRLYDIGSHNQVY
jgi:addiction module RelE/StbE family toxin